VRRIETGGLVYYQFEQWAGLPYLRHGVFTRLGGVSATPWASLNVGALVGDDPAAVEKNAALMFDALDVDSERACTVWQVHGNQVITATERPEDRKWIDKADAIITDKPGLPLNLRFADCVPVLFYDPAKHVLGIAHAGWRGTVSDVVGATVRAMQAAFGSDPATMQAAIGPSIGPEHYQVGEEVVDAVRGAFGTTNTSDGLIRRADDGSAWLDLWESNRRAAIRAGIPANQVEVSGLCTFERVDEFYSHRAEHGQTGRFGAVMCLQPLPTPRPRR
jgi:polyphenol oxidase